MNKACSVYIYEKNTSGETIKNEEVFSLLRYVVTGNPVGPPVGEVLDVLGKKIFMSRIENAISSNLY